MAKRIWGLQVHLYPEFQAQRASTLMQGWELEWRKGVIELVWEFVKFFNVSSPCSLSDKSRKMTRGVPVISIRPQNTKTKTFPFLRKWNIKATISLWIQIFLRILWPFQLFETEAKMDLQSPPEKCLFSHLPSKATIESLETPLEAPLGDVEPP